MPVPRKSTTLTPTGWLSGRSLAVSVASAAAALGISELWQLTFGRYTMAVGILAVAVSAGYSGFRIGFLTAGLFAAGMITLIIPDQVGAAGGLTTDDYARLANYLIFTLAVSGVASRLRLARIRAEHGSATTAALAEQLQAQTAELNDFVDNAAMPIVWFTPDGIVLRANQAELNMLCLTAEVYLGHSIREFYCDREVVDQMLGRLLAGETIREEVRLRGADGDIRFAHITANGFWRDGKLVQVRCFTQDVTPQRLAEDRLVRLKDQLEVQVAERTAELKRTTDELRLRHTALMRVSRQLVTVQETERRSIARELHDHIGQQLTALAVELRLLEQDRDFTDHRRDVITGSIANLDTVLKDLHNLAANLRPSALDHLGLAAALRLYLETTRARSGIKVGFEAGTLPSQRFSPEIEIAVYRIVQEGVTNAIRHAKPTRIDVILTHHAGQVSAVIEDDGVGFDIEAAKASGRLGLSGMLERAALVGGAIEIDTEPGRGTTLVARLPDANPIPISR